MDKSKCMIWIDLETTGLEAGRDLILEVACVVTDVDLNELGSMSAHVHHIPEAIKLMRDTAHPVVQKMRDDGGLWRDCEASGFTISGIEWMLCDFLERLEMPAKKLPMCGSTIAFGRGFIRQDMPRLHSFFSHRNYDVSVFREEAERRYPAIFVARPGQVSAHRAMPDIRQSIESLRYYRSTMLRPVALPEDERSL
jgi:oligoribonuclease